MTPRAWYPNMPPTRDGEDNDTYTNRLLGVPPHEDPYDHHRNRQCSIGFHHECSQRTATGSTIGASGRCRCPHHADPRLRSALPHITGFARAAEAGHLLGDVEAESVDVAIDLLGASDEPLRALATHWRTVGGHTGEAMASQLSAILEGRARVMEFGRWGIENPDGSHDLLAIQDESRMGG